MRINNKGFAITSIMYLILIITLMLILLVLSIMNNRKLILEKQKEKAQGEINSMINEIRVPKEYQEVEYIMSTAGALISIPYTLNISNKVVETEVSLSFRDLNNNDTYIMILAEGSANLYACTLLGKGSRNTIYAYNNGIASTYGETAVVGKKYRIKGTWDDVGHKRYLYINDVLQGVQNLQFDSNRINVAYLRFGSSIQTNWINYYNDGIYVKVDGVTVFDLVPCYRKSDGVVGFYDLIGNNFYESSGTGRFIPMEKANLPTEYQRVEYIESTGTQYIDTKYYPSNNTKVVLDYETTENTFISFDNMMFGISTGNGQASTLWIESTSSKNLYFRLGTYESSVQNFFTNNPSGILEFSKDGLYINGSLQSQLQQTQGDLSHYSMYLFARNRDNAVNSPSGFKCKSFKIYEGTTLVRNFVPCYTTKTVIDANGKMHQRDTIGMYDTIHNKFYTNQGSGTFRKGNKISQ